MKLKKLKKNKKAQFYFDGELVSNGVFLMTKETALFNQILPDDLQQLVKMGVKFIYKNGFLSDENSCTEGRMKAIPNLHKVHEHFTRNYKAIDDHYTRTDYMKINNTNEKILYNIFKPKGSEISPDHADAVLILNDYAPLITNNGGLGIKKVMDRENKHSALVGHSEGQTIIVMTVEITK